MGQQGWTPVAEPAGGTPQSAWVDDLINSLPMVGGAARLGTGAVMGQQGWTPVAEPAGGTPQSASQGDQQWIPFRPGGEIRATTWVDDLINSLPMVGGAAGGLAGGGRGPLATALAALLGAGGEGFKQTANTLRGRINLPPEEAISRMVEQALIQGSLEGGGRAFMPVSRWSMRNALKPGYRTVTKAGVPKTAEGTLSALYPQVDIAQEALDRGVPIRNSGFLRTDANVAAARKRAMEAVTEATNARPSVAGYLPEGQIDVPLGETPVPMGHEVGGSVQAAGERIPFSQRRSTQGMDVSPRGDVSQVYLGRQAKGQAPAVGDAVEGAGTVRRSLRDAGVFAPQEPLIPGQSQMIGVEETLSGAQQSLRDMATSGMPAEKRALEARIADFAGEYPNPVDLVTAQGNKDAWADAASQSYLTGEGRAETLFKKNLADSARQAIERRIPETAGQPGIRALNSETQTNVALRDALMAAFQKEHASGRNTFGAALNNPRVWGLIAHNTGRVGRFGPNTARAWQLATQWQDQPQRRQVGQ